MWFVFEFNDVEQCKLPKILIKKIYFNINSKINPSDLKFESFVVIFMKFLFLVVRLEATYLLAKYIFK